LLREKPLVAMQTLPNKLDCAVCAHCLRFVGPLECQMELLGRRQPLTTLCPEAVAWKLPTIPGTPSLPPLTRCSWGCGEVYCGAECRGAAEPVHRRLCVAQVADESAPLYQFKLHAMQSNEILLLCGTICAKMVAEYEQHGCWECAVLPYRHFSGALWWDVAVATDRESQEELAAALKSLCEESSRLLAQALWPVKALSCQCAQDPPHTAPPPAAPINATLLGNLIGIFERNQHGLRVLHPLLRYFRELGRLHPLPESPELEAMLGDIAAATAAEDCDSDDAPHSDDEEEDHSHLNEEGEGDEGPGKGAAAQRSHLHEVLSSPEEWFPPFDGQGLFPLGSLVNHSCEPNLTIAYPEAADEPLEARLVALCDISAGEEVTICYLDAADAAGDVAHRRRALRDYGFICTCGRCARETVDP